MRVAHRDHRKTYRTSLVDLTSTLLQRLHCGVVFEAHELVVLKVQLPELRELPKAVGQRRELVAAKVQHMELRELPDARGQRRELVFLKAQQPEPRHRAQRRHRHRALESLESLGMQITSR